MNVRIKKFDVEMDVKSNGIEFEIRDPRGEFLGDLILTKAKLIWCRGRKDRQNGISVSLEEFIQYMESE